MTSTPHISARGVGGQHKLVNLKWASHCGLSIRNSMFTLRNIFPGLGGWVGGFQASHSAPLCHIPSRCCFFTGPWTVTRSSLRVLRRVAAFCWPLRPVLLLVSFPRSRSPVVGVLGLCWMWRDVPFACPRPLAGRRKAQSGERPLKGEGSRKGSGSTMLKRRRSTMATSQC